MKKLLMSAAFVALLASPALAQSYDSDFGSGNIVREQNQDITGSAGSSYAYMPPHAGMTRLRGIRAQAMTPRDPDTVYAYGHYRGQDPDPNVRLELRRDDISDY